MTTDSHSPTHSEFCADIGSISSNALVSPVVSVAAGAVLSFWHRYDMENGYDGGRLDVSTDGGTSWNPVPAAAFLSGGYNGTISTSYGNPIGGSQAWTNVGGSLGNFIEARVDLSAYVGSNVVFRWLEGTDSSVTDVGWWVDSVSLSGSCIPLPVELQSFQVQ